MHGYVYPIVEMLQISRSQAVAAGGNLYSMVRFTTGKIVMVI